MSRDLDGIPVLVTGAAQGIGAGIARVLAREGARVAITDINGQAAARTASEIRTAGGDALALTHDVTDAASCTDVVSHVRDAFGSVDVLVNNAGISERIPFQAVTESHWDRMLAVNAKGPYLMIRTVCGDMIARHTGSIINVASLVGKAGALPFFSHYVASKFAVIGLTQCLAAELAPHGIRVNAVCPGVVRTPLWDPELRDIAAERRITVDAAWDAELTQIPLGRPQHPEDIGLTVAFLASARAANITGESINVNGGQLMD